MIADQFTTGNVTLHYRVEGQGPERLMLLHGVGASMQSWDGIIERLRDRFTILSFDLRGHGQSTKIKNRYEIDDFTHEALALADAVGFENFHLAGFSLGGLIAQNLVLTAPERVKKLFLLSTVAGRNNEEKSRVDKRLAALEAGERGSHFDASLSRWFSDRFRQENPHVIERLRLANAQNDPDCYVSAYRVLAQTDFGERLADIQCPTLIATGEFDIGSNIRMAKFMHRMIAGSQLSVLADMRHSVLTEAPEQIAALAADFFLKGDQIGG